MTSFLDVLLRVAGFPHCLDGVQHEAEGFALLRHLPLLPVRVPPRLPALVGAGKAGPCPGSGHGALFAWVGHSSVAGL